MDLKAVTFPALVIADDGWVQYLQQRDELSSWTPSGIGKYNRRRVVLYDSENCAWEVDSIVPMKSAGLYARVFGREIPARLTLRPISEQPLEVVLDALKTAIDADDDILTQWTGAEDLKASVRDSSSFGTLVDILRAQRAI
jgi:hypothetical protein